MLLLASPAFADTTHQTTILPQDSAPLKITEGRSLFLDSQYHRNYYWRVYVTAENTSGKVITAVRFRWQLLNVFDEKVYETLATGDDFGPIAEARNRAPRWESGTVSHWGWQKINTANTARKAVVSVRDVLFEDGSRWSAP